MARNSSVKPEAIRQLILLALKTWQVKKNEGQAFQLCHNKAYHWKCATSKGSDQPAYQCSLIRFHSPLKASLVLHHIATAKVHRVTSVFTNRNSSWTLPNSHIYTSNFKVSHSDKEVVSSLHMGDFSLKRVSNFIPIRVATFFQGTELVGTKSNFPLKREVKMFMVFLYTLVTWAASRGNLPRDMPDQQRLKCSCLSHNVYTSML